MRHFIFINFVLIVKFDFVLHYFLEVSVTMNLKLSLAGSTLKSY